MILLQSVQDICEYLNALCSITLLICSAEIDNLAEIDIFHVLDRFVNDLDINSSLKRDA